MTELNFNVENWFDCCEEIKPLVPIHWKEVANNQNCIPLDMDYDEYDNLAKKNVLHVITARAEKKLVGYHILLVKGHLHYKSSLTAFTDMYYLSPEYRKGFAGVNIFRFSDLYLKHLGVQRIITSTKSKLDKGKIFERLGYQKVDNVYSKILN